MRRFSSEVGTLKRWSVFLFFWQKNTVETYRGLQTMQIWVSGSRQHQEYWAFFTGYFHVPKLYMTLLFYSLCCCLCVSSFGSFPVFLFSRSTPTFYANIPDLYAKIPCCLVFYMQYHERCANGEGGSMGGVEASLSSYAFLIRRAF